LVFICFNYETSKLLKPSQTFRSLHLSDEQIIFSCLRKLNRKHQYAIFSTRPGCIQKDFVKCIQFCNSNDCNCCIDTNGLIIYAYLQHKQASKASRNKFHVFPLILKAKNQVGFSLKYLKDLQNINVKTPLKR